MKPQRHPIAVALAVLALGVLATVALASGGEPEDRPTTPAPTATSTPEARKEAVHHHKRRHAKRRRRQGTEDRAARSTATTTTPVHSRRSRGADDTGADDHRSGEAEIGDDRGGHEAETEAEDQEGRGRGRGGDDD